MKRHRIRPSITYSPDGKGFTRYCYSGMDAEELNALASAGSYKDDYIDFLEKAIVMYVDSFTTAAFEELQKISEDIQR